MEYLTLADIKEKIEQDTDTEGEEFIQESELVGYINDGIDEAEAEIHTLYEDYFLTKSTLSLVSGTEEYTLPADMYANKIRKLIYKNGSDIYPINQLRGKDKFLEREFTNYQNTTCDYKYMMLNASGSVTPKMLLVPPSRETLSNCIVLWYIRNANKLVDDDDVCDIPEFVSFVIQYAKVKIWEKEGHPNLEGEVAERERLRRLMVDTLSNMIPDADTKLEMDLSFYEEMS